jgi:hypothetical protein
MIFIFSHLSIPLLLEAMTQEWKYCLADSVLVPLSGNDLKAHLIVNPSGVCPVSQLCSPLSYLRCQFTSSVPDRSSRHTFTHTPPSSVLPPCVPLSAFPSHGILASHGKLILWYVMTFLSYSHTWFVISICPHQL